MAIIMKRLGAIAAFNLDRGGLSIMIIKGIKTGKSCDGNDERKVRKCFTPFKITIKF